MSTTCQLLSIRINNDDFTQESYFTVMLPAKMKLNNTCKMCFYV